MKKIKRLVCWLEDELDGAQKYAEKYVEEKASGNGQWASRFKDMANAELSHSSMIHQYIVEEVNKISQIYKPPEEMMGKWEKEHAEYVEKSAWIKQMLTL